MFRAQLHFLPPNQTWFLFLFPTSTNTTGRHLLTVKSPGVIPDSFLQSLYPLHYQVLLSLPNISNALRSLYHHHANLSPLLNHSPHGRQRALSKCKFDVTPFIELFSGFLPLTGQRSKPLTGAPACFSSIPQHPIAPCHTDSTFSDEPCSLLPLGLCTCSSNNHFAY